MILNKANASRFYEEAVDLRNENEKFRILTRSLVNNTDCIYAEDELEYGINRHKAGIIEVTKEHTIEAVHNHSKTGEKLCMMNFASSKNSGGGWDNGATAQEEAICYCSNLFWSLDSCTPLYEDNKRNLDKGLYKNNIVYSKNVTIIRDENYNLLEEDKWINVDCISMAAPNRFSTLRRGLDDSLVERELFSKIARLLIVLDDANVDNIILGAWGCGVFRNIPELVASLFKRALVDYETRYQFDKIIFAIPYGENYITVDVAEKGNIVISDGMFYACEDSVELKVVMAKSFSGAFLGNEGLFNLCLRGNGIAILESPVPEEDLIEIELTGRDELKIDGSYAVMWDDELIMTVEKSSKSLLGSSVNGEGLVNVFRVDKGQSSGRVWLSTFLK